MKYILLRKVLHYKEGIGFWRWLPYASSDALKVSINGIQLQLSVDLNYDGTSVFKIKEDNVSQGNHWINAIIIYLKVPVHNSKDPNLYRQKPPQEMVKRVADVLRFTISKIGDIIRNEIGQYWIINPHHINTLLDEEVVTGIQIRSPESKWVQFCPGLINADSYIPSPDHLINRVRWFKIKKLIRDNYKPDLSLVFLGNAQQYLINKEYRMALIESCIALERALSRMNTRCIPDKKRQSILSILKNDSLMDKVRNVLPYLIDKKEIDVQTITVCEEAVNIRNQIVHNARVRITSESANMSLSQISKVIRKLNTRKFSPIID